MDWTTFTSVTAPSVVALASIGLNFWQSNLANKLSEKRLEREREIDQKTWRRQVRSEPLFTFRTQLARIATKYERLVGSAESLHTRFGITEEQAQSAFERERQGFNEYLNLGDFQQASYMLDDLGIIEQMDSIIKNYRDALATHLNIRWAEHENIQKAFSVYKSNAEKIAKLQGIINKKLEEL